MHAYPPPRSKPSGRTAAELSFDTTDGTFFNVGSFAELHLPDGSASSSSTCEPKAAAEAEAAQSARWEADELGSGCKRGCVASSSNEPPAKRGPVDTAGASAAAAPALAALAATAAAAAASDAAFDAASDATDAAADLTQSLGTQTAEPALASLPPTAMLAEVARSGSIFATSAEELAQLRVLVAALKVEMQRRAAEIEGALACEEELDLADSQAASSAAPADAAAAESTGVLLAGAESAGPVRRSKRSVSQAGMEGAGEGCEEAVEPSAKEEDATLMAVADDEGAPAPVVVAQAEGLHLHLSSRSSTGYKLVRKGEGCNAGRFRVEYKARGQTIWLGDFDSAVEAAVAYARAVGEAPEPQAPTVATESEGLQLHLSDKNSTGYKGVVKDQGRFRAERWVGGRRTLIGTFDTAVEAAVARARAVAEPAAAAAAGAESAGPVRRSKRSVPQAGMGEVAAEGSEEAVQPSAKEEDAALAAAVEDAAAGIGARRSGRGHAASAAADAARRGGGSGSGGSGSEAGAGWQRASEVEAGLVAAFWESALCEREADGGDSLMTATDPAGRVRCFACLGRHRKHVCGRTGSGGNGGSGGSGAQPRPAKRSLEPTDAPPSKRRSSHATGGPSAVSLPASLPPSTAPATSKTAKTTPAATPAASVAAPPDPSPLSSRLYTVTPDGRIVLRETPPPPTGGMAAVAAALARVGLQAYVAAFDDEGFDDIEFLGSMDAAERAEVAEAAEMKPGHAAKFVKHGFERP